MIAESTPATVLFGPDIDNTYSMFVVPTVSRKLDGGMRPKEYDFLVKFRHIVTTQNETVYRDLVFDGVVSGHSLSHAQSVTVLFLLGDLIYQIMCFFP